MFCPELPGLKRLSLELLSLELLSLELLSLELLHWSALCGGRVAACAVGVNRAGAGRDAEAGGSRVGGHASPAAAGNYQQSRRQQERRTAEPTARRSAACPAKGGSGTGGWLGPGRQNSAGLPCWSSLLERRSFSVYKTPSSLLYDTIVSETCRNSAKVIATAFLNLHRFPERGGNSPMRSVSKSCNPHGHDSF